MKVQIDINNWKRKDHFEFFQQFSEPFHGVNVSLDISKLYQRAKEDRVSLTALYLHKFMLAINTTEAFRLRIENGDVFLYDRIDMGMTVLRSDETFAYSYTEFSPDYQEFSKRLEAEFKATKSGSEMRRKSTNYMIHGSILPWINFTGLSHARNLEKLDSIPKITFGKITMDRDVYQLPLAVHVHHALVDGIDVGKLINSFQANLNEV